LRWRHYWGCIFRVFGIQQAASAALGKRLRAIVLLISIEVGGLLVTFFLLVMIYVKPYCICSGISRPWNLQRAFLDRETCSRRFSTVKLAAAFLDE